MPLTHDHNATRRSETWVPGDPDLQDDDSDEEREDATAEPRTRPTYASDQRLAIFRTYANWVAPAKGPDMSMLDAGVNLYLKREIRQNRASTAAQQRAAMRAAWEKIPPSTMTNISKRVRRNMLKVIEQKGGNFYDE